MVFSTHGIFYTWCFLHMVFFTREVHLECTWCAHSGIHSGTVSPINIALPRCVGDTVAMPLHTARVACQCGTPTHAACLVWGEERCW